MMQGIWGDSIKCEDSANRDSRNSAFINFIQSAMDEHDRVVSSLEVELDQLRCEAQRLRQKFVGSCGAQPHIANGDMPALETSSACDPSYPSGEPPALEVQAHSDVLLANSNMKSYAESVLRVESIPSCKPDTNLLVHEQEPSCLREPSCPPGGPSTIERQGDYDTLGNSRSRHTDPAGSAFSILPQTVIAKKTACVNGIPKNKNHRVQPHVTNPGTPGHRMETIPSFDPDAEFLSHGMEPSSSCERSCSPGEPLEFGAQVENDTLSISKFRHTDPSVTNFSPRTVDSHKLSLLEGRISLQSTGGFFSESQSTTTSASRPSQLTIPGHQRETSTRATGSMAHESAERLSSNYSRFSAASSQYQLAAIPSEVANGCTAISEAQRTSEAQRASETQRKSLRFEMQKVDSAASTASCNSETYEHWRKRHLKGSNSSESVESCDEESNDDQPMNSMPARRCNCGVRFCDDDHFCRGCGAQRRLVMDRCYSCGKKLADEAHFCEKCGRARQVGHEIVAGKDVGPDRSSQKAIQLHRWLHFSDLNGSVSFVRTMTTTMTTVGLAIHNDNERACIFDRMVHQPINPFRIAFDICGAVLILYDAIVLPLNVFEFDESPFTDFIHYVDFYYWNANLLLSFFVSYLENEAVVLQARKTALRYIRSWFALDVLVLLPDWLAVFLGDSSRSGNVGFVTTILKTVRLLRFVRLLRLAKLFSIASRVREIVQINSELLNILANVLKSVALLLAINHLIACAWYFCANSQREAEKTWIRSHGFEEDKWYYVYATSLHWSLTQFTPASMNVQPQNLTERIFTVVTVVFAMTTFSYILGSVSSSMAELRKLHEDYARNFWYVRRFMRQHGVELHLSFRIQKYLENKLLANQKKLQFSDVPLFKLLSQQFVNELIRARIGKFLEYHPLFEFSRDLRIFMNKLVEKSITEQHLSGDDCLFFQAEPATHMHLIREGEVEYSQLRSGHVATVESEHITAGEAAWIGEAALWLDGWLYRGCTIMVRDSEIIYIDARAFAEVSRKHYDHVKVLCEYAGLFSSLVQAADTETDIHRRKQENDVIAVFFHQCRKKRTASGRPSKSSFIASMARQWLNQKGENSLRVEPAS